MIVPSSDLVYQYDSIKSEIDSAIKSVIDSQKFILGPAVEQFEQEMAEYLGVGYAVGVSSGTDALLMSLMSAGIGEGDLVITTPYTFFATAGSIARVGATPVFADIDRDTYNISPESVEECIHNMGAIGREYLKAMIPVHLFGQCADMSLLIELANEYDLIMIEDAAQAIGAIYDDQCAGSIGGYGCFSFFPSKNLGCYGDGGMVVTNSEEAHDRLKALRIHGSSQKYSHEMIGGNFRLDTIQAAVLSVKLKHLKFWTSERQRMADVYRDLIFSYDLDNIISFPKPTDGHVYNQFIAPVWKRDELMCFMKENRIGVKAYYPIPLHLQECFKHLGYKKGNFPIAESASKHTLALPIYPGLLQAKQEYVIETIHKFYS